MESKNRSDLKVVKRIVIALIIVAAVSGIALLVIQGIEKKNKEQKEKETVPPRSYHYYSEDYEEDIFANEEYMNLDRSINYSIPAMGTTESLDEKSVQSKSEAVRFFYDYFQTLLRGDAKTYNSYLSATYLTQEGNFAYDAFTPQKIYNITFYQDTDSSTEKDEVWVLEYMIFQNNGSFRTDIGSDMIRPVYVTISKYGAEYKIDRIVYYRSN